MTSPRSTLSLTPYLIGLASASLCLVAAGNKFLPSVFLMAVVVPTGVRTCLILERRHASGQSSSLATSSGVLFDSAARSVLIVVWFTLVILFTAELKTHRETLLFIPMILLGLTLWLIFLLLNRREEKALKKGRIDWRQLLDAWFSTRGLIVGVAFIAIMLWPVHLWRMRPKQISLMNHEELLATLCEAESQNMSGRAEECRRRAYKGISWDLDDDISNGLKASPYPNDRPGHSWLEMVRIWDRAVKRSDEAARRHWAKSLR